MQLDYESQSERSLHMMEMRPWTSLVSSRALLLTCVLPAALSVQLGCDDPDLGKVAPLIEIAYAEDATTSPCTGTTEAAGTDDPLRITECSHAFGEVPQGQGRYARFLISNPSPIDLTLSDVRVEGDPAFRVVSTFTDTVERYDSQEVIVQFAPTLASNVQATLIIEHNGTNLTENATVDLLGVGLDLGSPELVITPAECNFGDVGVGVTAFCDLTLENIGNRDLEITSVGFAEETPVSDPAVFGSQTIFPIPTFIAPGTGMSVRLYAQPQTADGATGALTLGSNDPNRPDATVPLSVTGAVAPTAIPEILTINGQPVNSPSPQVGPLDDVTLTGEASLAANEGATIVDYRWEIVNQPAESQATLTNPNSMTTGFEFASSGGSYQGLDVAGTYEVLLTVTDSNGLTSTNDARITLNAIPQEALLVQLTWDTASGDIDLHLNKDGGSSCGTSTCYYANCKATSLGSTPEWDGVNGRTNGDPTLDVDDLSGYGPENINVDYPSNGTYNVGVDYYSGSTSSWATVKIYVNSALQYENSAQMSSSDWWNVASIDWNNGAAILTPGDSAAGSAGSAPSWGCN